MKKDILITGANSYVGTNVEKWLMKEPDKYHVETLDMKDPNWKNFDFSKFDVVFHVAGIAHVKETKKNKHMYKLVNEDLAIETALYAKESGVKQFIFMSTMSVFGISNGVITQNTPVKPTNEYGKSKRNAELAILELNYIGFKTSILRPPMIYGPNAAGNYFALSNFVKKFRIFPKIKNKKSFIFIDHFSEFVKIVISNHLEGTYHPQNAYVVGTTDIVKEIKKVCNVKILMTKFLNFVILLKFIKKFSKLFGTLYYDNSLYNTLELNYIALSSIYDFNQTIRLTENKK